MKQRALFLFLFTAALLLAGTAEVGSQTAAPAAEPILQKMAEAYSAMQSYSDKSTAIYRKRDGSEQLTVDFKIWFARPASFRVDAESRAPGSATPPRREVLWADGAVTRNWATGKPVTSRPKVQLAGSGMFGTYAYHIPTLLEASYAARRRLHELTSAVVSGEELFEGVDCYRVSGQWDSDAYEVWIGKADHLARRIVATYSDHQLEEIHRDMLIDQPIPPETFRFAPENEAVPPNAEKPTPPKR